MIYHSLLVLLAVGANAEWDSCQRAKGKWIAIDQGNGRSNVNAITYFGTSKLIAVGHAYGNMSFSSNHVVNGPTGEVLDHEKVVTHHATHSRIGGKYSNPASSQLGMDSVIYEISTDGVPGRVYAIDTNPSDGKVTESENGGSLGYSWFDSVDTDPTDANNIIAAGTFRGNLTFPIGSTPDYHQVSNRKSGDYDGFVVKINANTMEGIWAVAPGQTPKGRNYARRVAVAASGKIFVASDYRPDKDYIGRIFVLNKDTGAVEFTKDLTGAYYLYGLSAAGEFAYVGGRFKGNGVNPVGTGNMVSAKSGEDESGFVAKLDTAGVGQWAVSIGSSVRSTTTTPDGNHLYAVGAISDAWTSGTCALTGKAGGFIVKMSVTDGACVWAKDIGTSDTNKAVAADANYVYTFGNEDVSVSFGSTTVYTSGTNNDWVLAKMDANTGAGQWAQSVGGNDGSEYAYGLAAGADGIAFVGWAVATSIDFFGVTLKNLQQAEGAGGQRAGIIGMVDQTGQSPSCLIGCSTTTTAVTVATGKCYAGGKCYTDGDFDQFRSCFKCESAVSQTAMQGPNTENHCYIDGVCRNSGDRAPSYQKYNEASICEVCSPSINPTGWSLAPGFVHDRDIANTQSGRFRRGSLDPTANAFNIIFDSGSNGCQVLPSIHISSPVPASVTKGYGAAALVKSVVTGTLSAAATPIAALGASTSMQATVQRAIDGVGEFAGVAEASRKAFVDKVAWYAIPVISIHELLSSPSLTAWQTAWAYYNGDEATCTKQTGNSASASTNHVCEYTPAAFAETLAGEFSTKLHYGAAIANIKVKQALALGVANAEATSPDQALGLAFALDVMVQTMIPEYQALSKHAIDMDCGASCAPPSTSAAEAYASWLLVQDQLLAQARDQSMHVATIIRPTAVTSGNEAFCAVKDLLSNHLPNASALVYTGTHGTSAMPGLEYPHVTTLSAAVKDAEDLARFDWAEHIGTLPKNKGEVNCPAYSPSTLQPSTHTMSMKVTASGAVSDYTPAIKEAIAVNIAVKLAVDVRYVAVSVQAGSVVITILVGYTSAEAAEAAATNLNAALANEAAVSDLLSTSDLKVTVASFDQAVGATDDLGTGLSTGAIVGIAIGGVVAFLLLVTIIIMSMKRKKEGKPIFLCLDEVKTDKQTYGSNKA